MGVLVLAACSSSPANSPVNVAIIGEAEAERAMNAASAEGLVSVDGVGEIIPALAERWIITDDGLSYIFRLRNSDWPSGEAMSAEMVRRRLLQNISNLDDKAFAQDLAIISEVRAMTGRVIEIRLKSPMPGFLRLMAQSELGILDNDKGAGPMIEAGQEQEEEEDGTQTTDGAQEEGARQNVREFEVIPPEERGYPQQRGWKDLVRLVRVKQGSARSSVNDFAAGEAELVLGGRMSTFPLADIAPFSRANIRLDAPSGLFGLLVRSERGVLASAQQREALSMAIDRPALLEKFNIEGWQGSAVIVPRTLWRDFAPEPAAWLTDTLEERRTRARARIAAWEEDTGETAQLSLFLPPGPGSDWLFERIAADFASIGVELTRVGAIEAADLSLYDELARYIAPRWYLNQFHCSVGRQLCSAEADALAAKALSASSPRERNEMMARAALALNAEALFIPFGAPIRWSLVRSTIEGFEENRWGAHPLFALSGAPI